MSEPIPEAVCRFLAENINSVEQLEVLLFLKGSPDRDWTAEQVSQVLYSQPGAIRMRLEDLRTRGLLASKQESPDQFRYAPASAEQDHLITQLADVYRTRRVSVIGFIYSRPQSHVQAFADAFRFRKDK